MDVLGCPIRQCLNCSLKQLAPADGRRYAIYSGPLPPVEGQDILQERVVIQNVFETRFRKDRADELAKVVASP